MRCLLPVMKLAAVHLYVQEHRPIISGKRIYCLLVFTLLCLPLVAQKADSISVALALAPNDSVRVRILSHQSETAPDGVWEGYTVQLKELTERKLAEEKSPRLQKFYAKHLAVALNNLGLNESNKGNYGKAAEYWEETQQMARRAEYPTLEATALSNICRQYYNSGQLQKAFDGFHRALSIYRSTGDEHDKSRIATVLNYLGDIYRAQNDLPNAAKSYAEALAMLKDVLNKARLADSYNRLGMVATLQKDEKTALMHYTNALEIYRQRGNTRGVMSMQFQLGKLKAKMEKWKEALPYYYETLTLLKKTEQNYLLLHCLSGIGQAYYQLGQMDSASYYFDQHILLDKDFKNLEILMETAKLAYQIQKKQGNMTKALALHELYLRAKDSIFNDNSRKALLKSQYKYEYDKKTLVDRLKTETERHAMTTRLAREKDQRLKIEIERNIIEARRLKTQTENNVLEASLLEEKNQRYTIETEKNVMEARRLKAETEKNVLAANLIQEKNQRYALLGGLALVLMTAGFGFTQYRTRQRLKELKLRNQIASDLHDEVGSAISSISLFAGMARMKPDGETAELVEKIEETSRETINTMSDIVWSIEPANDNFHNVLRKMKQFGEQLAVPLGIVFEFIVGPGIEKLSLDMKQRKNIFLVYKEAVNNSCKHAHATAITVILQKKSGTLVMTITDNGRGFDINHDSSGYGTGSMKARTADLQGKLEITSSAVTGTQVTLVIPC